MGYSSEERANAHARWSSLFHNKYITSFCYKGRWYLTDCYDRG